MNNEVQISIGKIKMNQEELKNFKEYYTPRTQNEQLVFDKQVKQKLNTISFLALSAGSFGLAPVLGVGILGVGAFSAGVYCTCKLMENYKLATENLNLFHAMKRENNIHSENYKELGKITEVINNENSTIGNIVNHIKKLRHIEEIQKNKPKL